MDTTTTRLGSGVVAPDHIDGSTAATPAAATPDAVHPRRRLLVGAAFAGPVALAVQYVLSSGDLPREEAGAYLAGLAENPTSNTIAVAIYLVAMIAGVANAAMLALAGRRRAPWLSGIAAALLVVGTVGGIGFAGLRLVAIELSQQGDPGAPEFWTAVQTGTPFHVLEWFLIMAIAGTLVAAAALFRARADIAVWAAPALVIGFVLASGEFPVWGSVVGNLVVLASLVPVARAALRA